MIGGGRCAVVADQGSEGRSGDGTANNLESAVDVAIRHGTGSFDEIVTVSGVQESGDLGSFAFQEAGAGRARARDSGSQCSKLLSARNGGA